jgi:hypothetical protein
MTTSLHSKASRSLLPALVSALALVNFAEAGNRRFTYSYETTTMAKGEMELETWMTWKTQKSSDPGFERFDFRHEFEYGYSDRLQLAFYFLDWRYQESDAQDGESTFHDIAFEAIYNLTDPNQCPFGSALYGEIKGSDDFIELEAKILLQKNIGSWMFVYNFGGEVEWEDEYQNDEGELMQSLGASYQFNPSWSLGAEFLQEIAIPDVEDFGDSSVYLGPNVSWQKGNFAIALSGLWQLTTLADEPDFQLRTIVSYSF